MFNTLPTPGQPDRNLLFDTFEVKLARFSGEVIVEACDRFIEGKVGKKTRAPFLPEFLDECEERQQMAHYRAKAEQIERVEEESVEQTPEERARVKFMMALWSAAFGAVVRMDRLAEETSLKQRIQMGRDWGVPVPEEVLKQVRS